MNLDKIEYMILCKYAEITGFDKPINCEYRNTPFKQCPKDSGTNGKCNKVCYEYKMKEGDA